MLKKDAVKIKNYFEIFLLIFLFAFFIYMIRYFLMSIFLAATFVFLLYKPYNLLVKKIPNRSFCALFVMILFLVVIIVPLYFLGNVIMSQTISMLNVVGKSDFTIDMEFCRFSFCRVIEDELAVFDFESLYRQLRNYIINSSSAIFTSVTSVSLNILIFMLAFFFFLKDGDYFLQGIKKMIPMKNSYKEILFYRFKEVSQGVLIDCFFIAFVQGMLVALGFWLVGLPSAMMWGIIACFFALLPMIGTAFVWLPAVIYLVFSKNYIFAIFLFIYGSLIVGLSDNFLRAMLLKKRSDVHPFLIFLAVFGGLSVFGFFGIFIGPIIISLLVTMVHLYKLEFE